MCHKTTIHENISPSSSRRLFRVLKSLDKQNRLTEYRHYEMTRLDATQTISGVGLDSAGGWVVSVIDWLTDQQVTKGENDERG